MWWRLRSRENDSSNNTEKDVVCYIARVLSNSVGDVGEQTYPITPGCLGDVGDGGDVGPMGYMVRWKVMEVDRNILH